MRFMLSFQMPTHTANALIKEGSFPQTMQSIMEDLKPEAAYFTDVDGARGGIFIINMDDASELPGVAEPLLHALGATIKLQLVMTRPQRTCRRVPQRWSRRHRSMARRRSYLGRGLEQPRSSSYPYSPKCLEEEVFSELHR